MLVVTFLEIVLENCGINSIFDTVGIVRMTFWRAGFVDPVFSSFRIFGKLETYRLEISFSGFHSCFHVFTFLGIGIMGMGTPSRQFDSMYCFHVSTISRQTREVNGSVFATIWAFAYLWRFWVQFSFSIFQTIQKLAR